MNVRAGSITVAALVLACSLAGCTQAIDGTPGPRPTVSGGGDFSTGSTASDEPTDTGSPTDSTESPTDEPTPTDTGAPSEDGSVESLCSDMSDSIDGPDIGQRGYQALIGLDILGWGLANGDSDPFSKADAATTKTCPDVRTAVLAKTGTPDLKSVNN